jgi:hypothetical protein
MMDITALDTEILKARCNGLTEQAGIRYLRDLLDISQADALSLHKLLFPKYHMIFEPEILVR